MRVRRPVARRSFAASSLAAALLAAVALAGCQPEPSPADPPVPEEHPAPQAAAGEATELRDAIQAPQDKARAVEATLQQADAAQRAAIDAAESGEAPADGG